MFLNVLLIMVLTDVYPNASKPENRIEKHFVFISCKMILLKAAIRPTFPKIAFNEEQKKRLALSTRARKLQGLISLRCSTVTLLQYLTYFARGSGIGEVL